MINNLEPRLKISTPIFVISNLTSPVYGNRLNNNLKFK